MAQYFVLVERSGRFLSKQRAETIYKHGMNYIDHSLHLAAMCVRRFAIISVMQM